MKNKKAVLYLLSFLFIMASCEKDLDKLNIDTKNATSAKGETFFSNALKNMADVMNQPSYGNNGPLRYGNLFVQHISEITYIDASRYFIANHQWGGIYQGVLKNLQESKKTIDDEVTSTSQEEIVKANKLATIEIAEVHAYAILVEAYGNIPYTEALDSENVSPKYDDGIMVYTDLLKRLSEAIAKLDPTAGAFNKADLLYNGDVSSWIKFGNSLKFKMGMRIVDFDPVLADQTVTAAVASGVFTSNDDNALFEYLGSSPNTNPLWVLLVQGNRKDQVASAALVDTMNKFDDPRRSVYFSKIDGTYTGTKYGTVTNYDLYSHMGDIYFTPTLEGVFLDYASIQFLLAEAAERSLIGNPSEAETHYNNAIKASFDYLGVSSVDGYLSQSNVAYKSASGTWKEKIALQKWIALYNQGFEAWTEYRRLDYPILIAPEGAFVNSVPVRLTYPVSEQTLNSVYYKEADAAIGGDLLTTKLFWDKY